MGNKIRSPEYRLWLKGIKKRIAASRVKAALSANHELIALYWFLGNQIIEKQKSAVWGSGFINQFSKDLRHEFPEMKGFSPKNLRYCRAFCDFYSSSVIWQQAVAKFHDVQIDEFIPRMAGQIPWGHNIHVFTKSKSFEEAIFYIQETIENGWSRDVLALQIKSHLFERQGKAVSNFQQTLPAPHSELAQQTLKDPYSFDFLTLTKPYNERDIENQLIGHMTRFLLELGKGFAFVGRQYHMEIGESDYYLDLLFYHITLRCYVVVELKNTKFVPEYAGKLNFYLSAVDSLLKSENENPTIGILLCRDKNRIETEFALRDMNKPMGVSEFDLTEILPENLKASFPTVEEIEADLRELAREDSSMNDE